MPLRDELNNYGNLALKIGGGCLGLCILAAFVLSGERDVFLHSYLWAYTFWLGLTLGCGTICMIHNLTGGRWGQAGKRIWLAANGCIVVMALMSLPLLIGAWTHHVWLWAGDAKLLAPYPHKQQFFQFKWVMIRGCIYFAIWIGSSFMLAQGQKRIEQSGSYAVRAFYAKLSAPCIILYMLTLTFAVIDWIISLEPYYFSTMYAFIYATGEVLSGFAFAVLVTSLLMKRSEFAGKVDIEQYADMGTFTFAWTILWAYTAFFQFLISWMGNLRLEMQWYVRRTTGIFDFLAVCLILFQFCIPFVLLLQRPLKRTPNVMIGICGLIMVMRTVDLYWMIKPAFPTGQISWMDPFVLVGIGGIFMWAFLGRLNRGPITPPPLLPGENPPTGHGHAAISHVAAMAKAQGVTQI